MSLSDAFIRVECDTCGGYENIPLLGGFDGVWCDWHVPKRITGLGWSVDGEKHTCPQCIEESSPYYKYGVGYPGGGWL